jgi:hypothetical protein
MRAGYYKLGNGEQEPTTRAAKACELFQLLTSRLRHQLS